MKIGVLTSSRADFGIYLPLIKILDKDAKVDLRIIAFGTHLSKSHGYTLDEIEEHEFKSIDKIQVNFSDDSPKGISKTYGEVCLKFASYWADHKYDLVFCLGDRFEMQAAVQAGIPLRVKFTHIHGGETTEGAIDNIYRHQISLASSVHFASTTSYKNRLTQLLGHDQKIYNVGSLSLDEIVNLSLPSMQEVCQEFQIPESNYILTTFHPETVSIEYNEAYVNEMSMALQILADSYQIVITMPNADTMGSIYRSAILKLAEKHDNVYIVESFGKMNYFTVMKNALCILGNSSSGIIEAATFGKYVVNVGDRQKGRQQSQNVMNVSFDSRQIIDAVKTAIAHSNYEGENIYYQKNVAMSIINVLKKELSNA